MGVKEDFLDIVGENYRSATLKKTRSGLRAPLKWWFKSNILCLL